MPSMGSNSRRATLCKHPNTTPLGQQLISLICRLAYRSGVTTAISAPTHLGFLSGVSVAFAPGTPHKLARGAIIKDAVAVHVAVARGGAASVSTQIAALRRYLLDPPEGEAGKWFGEVVRVRGDSLVFNSGRAVPVLMR